MNMSEIPATADILKMIGGESSQHSLWMLLKEYTYDGKPI